MFGGRVVPILESPCSVWFRQNLDEFSEVTAARDFGPEELPLSVADGRVPFGANYAVRAIEQRQFPYDVNLGAGTGRAAEEIEVVRSILDTGHSGYWIPEATVYHIIAPDRQTTQYVTQRYKTQGATEIYLMRRDRKVSVSLILMISRSLGYTCYTSLLARLISSPFG